MTDVNLPQFVGEKDEGRPASAFLMDGKAIGKTLFAFKPSSLAMLHQGEAIEIPFSGLRALEFSQPMTQEEASEFLLGRKIQIRLPPAPEPFSVDYIDGQKISGNAYCLIQSGNGLHLLEGREDRIVQQFIPMACVREYQPSFRLGEALIEEEAVSREDLHRALAIQEELRKKKIGDYFSPLLESGALRKALEQQIKYDPGIYRIGELLVKEGAITEAQLEEAVAAQQRDRKKRIGDILVEMEATTTETLNAILAKKLGIPFVRLKHFDIDPLALSHVPIWQAQKHRFMPCMLYEGNLVVAIDNPLKIEALNMLRFTTGMNILVAMASPEDIEWAIDNYYAEQPADLDVPATGDTETEKAIKEIERLGQEKPIVKFVNDTLLDAIRRHASDIHIRPLKDHVALLYRIDGTLTSIRDFNKRLLPGIVSRIKILGRMNIAESRLPQDGAARILYNGKVVDQRISVIPTVYGESVVIRILNTEVGLKSIPDLGFSLHDERSFTDLLHRSYGIILVTGPTGSGKSTTLYAALGEVIKQNVNIITVEDPVEYHIDKVEQIQVNPSTGLTFAKALRHILRHDPDVIMIGEIRDQETARIAIESALTGHIVLSSLHTNSAASAYTRLLEMGIEDYLLNSTVLGVLAQRLVRKNCPHCIAEEDTNEQMREMLKVASDETFFHGKGCDQCNYTGYSGRIAVYELLIASPNLREHVRSGVTADKIHQLGIGAGMVPLTENALSQARLGKTSLSEVYRVRLE